VTDFVAFAIIVYLTDFGASQISVLLLRCILVLNLQDTLSRLD